MFILVSFEGPDPYSQAGGLGVRITGLTQTLADLGHETHLFFIGDPSLPGEETMHGGRLILHRWAQHISADHAKGVYDGEAAKVQDVTDWLPGYMVDQLIRPAVAKGHTPTVVLEEWQTAECACRVSELLTAAGIRERVVIMWNANNCYGFERIDWPRLSAAAMITTVSRYMRSIIRSAGTDARVIPNGIPESLLSPVSRREVAPFRDAMSVAPGSALFFKMARYEREKGWTQALDAVAQTSPWERRIVLVARSGGPTGAGGGVEQQAMARGLRVAAFDDERSFVAGLGASIRAGADVISLQFGVSPMLARRLYVAADGVLANSVSEPFGLVGLETMAAGGVAYAGGTGEDYAVGGRNAVVLETLDPAEIVTRWEELASAPEREARLRRAAKKTAQLYAWPVVAQMFIEQVRQQARRQGLSLPNQDSRPRASWFEELENDELTAV